jgi:hypothetical protein
LVHSKLIPALIAAVVVAIPAGAQTAARHSTKSRPTTHASSSSGASGAWHSIYSDESVKVSMDPTQTKRSTDGTYRVRLRWQYPTNQMIGTKHAYRTMIDRKMIDCTTQGIKPVSAQTYDANGKAVAGYDTPDSQLAEIDWAKRPPGSSAGKAYAAVCGAIRK